MKGDWIPTVQHAAFESEYSCAAPSPIDYMLYGCKFQASTGEMTAGLSAGYVRNSSDLHPFYQEIHVHFPQVVVDGPSSIGDGNFNIILSLWKVQVQVKLKFHGVGILISSYPCGCGQSRSI